MYEYISHLWARNDVFYNNKITDKFNPINTDINKLENICMWNHHDLREIDVKESFIKRINHMNNILDNENTSEKTLLLFIEKNKNFDEFDKNFYISSSKKIIEKYKCNIIILIPFLNYNNDPLLVNYNNYISFIYFSSNCNIWGADIDDLYVRSQYIKIAEIMNNYYLFNILDRNNTDVLFE